jgi:high-affinity iron transporter
MSTQASALPQPNRILIQCLLVISAALIGSLLIWQGISAHGSPDPTIPHTSRFSALLDIGVLVFREGLECILVLTAITASMVGDQRGHRRPVMAGAGLGFVATILTWFIAVGIITDLTQSVSALDLQAATGLLAVLVLLVVMNWFFHKVYWGGWITLHNRQKKKLLRGAEQSEISQRRVLLGLALLGFSSLYREGVEIVLFLQSYRLKMGTGLVVGGAVVGLFATGLVAVLAFVAHRRLPYRKMLVLTGVMLGFVLVVMVGEQAQEMQLAHWIPTTTIPVLSGLAQPWMGVWFSFYPTVETIFA